MRAKLTVGLVVLAISNPVLAGDDTDPPPPPAVFQAVIECGKVTEPQARLACYDSAVAALGAANRNRELAVFDRSAVREARRGIFGLSLPSFKIFGGDKDDEVTAIDGVISNVRIANDGMPIFILEDGARWKQTDGRNVFAKGGQAIHIKRGSLGSYIANVAKQPGVRVVRMAN